MILPAFQRRQRAAIPALARILAVSTLFLGLCPFNAAHADGYADEAELQFEAGITAYNKGDFRTALEHFLVSNRLVPNWNVTYNIARMYEQLERYPDAYRYYVDALGAGADAKTAVEIQTSLTRIAPRVAVLRVDSDPPGAIIYFDRKDLGARGRTPKPLAIAEGKYKVIVELDGYEPAVIDDVRVKTGTESPVAIKLKRIVGSVQVSLDGAPSAFVHLDREDGPPQCTAPCTFEAPPGSHILYFTRDGYAAAPRQVEVPAKDTIKIVGLMNPLTGSLVVQADERDALIEIDGQPAGFTPTVIPNVAVGAHQIKVTLRGYAPIERHIVIRANEQTKITDVRLLPLRQVTAASRFAENIDDAPSSVTILDGQELRAFGYPTIAEALRGTRGIALSYDRVYWSAAIRGLGDPRDYNNRLLVLQDGTVMNDNILAASFIGNDARADLEDVERIEVVRGPGSLVYGTGAMSGVVNLVPRSKDRPTSAHVGIGTYENGTLRARAGFQLNFDKIKNAGVWASVSGAGSNGFDLAVEPRSAPGTTATANRVDSFQSFGTAGRAWLGPWTAQWFYHTRAQNTPTGPYSMRFNDSRALYQDTRFMSEVRFEPKISETVSILARAYVNRYTYHGNYVYEAPPAEGYAEDYTGTWFGAEGRAIVTPRKTLRMTFGGEVQGNPQANMIGCGNYKANNQQCPPMTTDAAGVPTGDSYLDVKQQYATGAIYGLVDWGALSWLRFSLGARGDFSTLLTPQFVLRGAAIVKPWRGGLIKVMGGNAFRRPSIFERLYWDGGAAFIPAEDQNGSQNAPFIKGGLRAESIVNGEIEISQRIREDWIALASAHTNYVRDIITSYEIDPATGTPTPGSGLVQFRNSLAPALNTGLDLELRRDWRQGWMISAFYGYQRPQFLGLQNNDPAVIANPGLLRDAQLKNAPQHLAGFRGVVPIVPELASLALRLTLEGPRRVTYADNPNTPADESAEFTRAAVGCDLALSGNIKKFGIAYGLGIYNIADQRYALPITEVYFSRLSPQNGRTFLANVSVTYP